MSKTTSKVTTTTCDVCGREVQDDESSEGIVRVSDTKEIRFDICDDDRQKLFGSLEEKPRRWMSRRKEAAAA